MAEPVNRNTSQTSISVPPTSINGGSQPVNVIPNPQNVIAPKLRARTMGAERIISRLLRAGAVMSIGLFAGSVLLEAAPQTEAVSVAVDLLRKAGLVVLLVTPLARLMTSSAVLAAKGELRYAMYGAGVLVLLAISLSAGI